MTHKFLQIQLILATLLFGCMPIYSQTSEHSSFALNGKISYIRNGAGNQTYILLPGIGETKEGYQPLVQELETTGVVYSLDIRGQGGSSSDFTSFSALDVAKDVIEFLDEKKLKNTILVGSSLSAASAVYVGAERSDLVKKIVLSGPFVRDHEISFGIKTMISIGFRYPWGAKLWKGYYEDLHITVKPNDLSEQSERIYNYLNLDNRLSILREYLFSSKAGCEEKLDSIKVPVVIIMGGKDPDFENPVEELDWIAGITNGKKFLFENSGHYPHREEPKRFAEVINLPYKSMNSNNK
ncbi:alpha/beta fold hydrolase [Leptospira sp. GIMC2001]|uniref:alpha/beta fold hydrolase n=1 Tax=Leptospira sp. GIMC2001 TaxID=1513297 RepID=UPI00234AAD77|nr:alpha/beta hydrolase [Leptospira sp. GIMC2001]WCL49697.1 alpha/beta hydrolase [Leptospira sp. GIMC2001]